MGYKCIVSKNKDKIGHDLQANKLKDCGSFGFRRITVSLPMQVQQSRALYRTNVAKVKRQKENGLISELPGSPFCPFF